MNIIQRSMSPGHNSLRRDSFITRADWDYYRSEFNKGRMSIANVVDITGYSQASVYRRFS